MERLVFKCETITPMFCYGADGKNPKIRPASIKGALRFWWRALHGDLDINALHQREADLFGGSGEKDARKSKIGIRVDNERCYPGRVSPVPHRIDTDPKKCFQKKAIMPNSTFDLIITINQGVDINRISNLVYVLSILGGIGNRSRRGFGAFKIKGKNYNLERDDIINVIRGINDNFNINGNSIIEYPYLKDIIIGQEGCKHIISEEKYCKKNEYILNVIGYSSHKNNGENLVKEKYDKKKKRKISVKEESVYMGFTKGSKRLSSPIYVSVLEKNGNYYPIVSKLNVAPDGNRFFGKNATKEFIEDIQNREYESVQKKDIEELINE